jgi:hypothetical protein
MIAHGSFCIQAHLYQTVCAQERIWSGVLFSPNEDDNGPNFPHIALHTKGGRDTDEFRASVCIAIRLSILMRSVAYHGNISLSATESQRYVMIACKQQIACDWGYYYNISPAVRECLCNFGTFSGGPRSVLFPLGMLLRAFCVELPKGENKCHPSLIPKYTVFAH